jgi:hypothetical protein
VENFIKRVRSCKPKFPKDDAYAAYWPKGFHMRLLKRLILVLIIGALFVITFVSVPALRTSIPGRIIRFCLGEPGATQEVNDAADTIISSGWTSELETLTDKLMLEYAPITSTLKKAQWGDGYLLPLDRLPAKFRKLGGFFGDPELILRTDANGIATALVLSWGHMRHSITIFAIPPSAAPQGFFSRQIGKRIYIAAVIS